MNDFTNLIEIHKQESQQKLAAMPELERDACAICLEENIVRRCILPCGHVFCMKCVCKLFEIFDWDHGCVISGKQMIPLFNVFECVEMLTDFSANSKNCPLCRNPFAFDDILIDELLDDEKKRGDGFIFEATRRDTCDCVVRIYMFREEPTINISLIFYFKIVVPTVREYKINKISVICRDQKGKFTDMLCFMWSNVLLRDAYFIDECKYYLLFEFQ